MIAARELTYSKVSRTKVRDQVTVKYKTKRTRWNAV